jgi:hypothetical protein
LTLVRDLKTAVTVFKKKHRTSKFLKRFFIIRFILIIYIVFQVTAFLGTLELQDSTTRKSHFALFNCLVLGHTKYYGVQRVYCNPFPAKTFHGSHCMDVVMIRPPGVDNGAFVVLPDTVWLLPLVCSGFASVFSICCD